MGYHHTAFATRDTLGTHKFYTEAMGFELVKVIAGPTENGGWAKHLFYEMSPDTYIAFWELHDDKIPDAWSPSISTGQGLPIWVNHLAFRAKDLGDIETRKQRLLQHGHVVSEVDHGFCTSIYCVDPNGILVEFCTTTQAMTQADKDEALRLLGDSNPKIDPPKSVQIFHPEPAQTAAAG